MEKQVALWSFDVLSQSPWFDPAINPKGSWGLIVNTAKKAGFVNVEKYMPPEPKAQFIETKAVKDKWVQIKQGEIPEIEPSDDVMALYMGFSQLNAEERDTVDQEYLPNLDVFMFQLNIAMMKSMQQQAQEKQANEMAMGLIDDVEQGRVKKEEVVDA